MLFSAPFPSAWKPILNFCSKFTCRNFSRFNSDIISRMPSLNSQVAKMSTFYAPITPAYLYLALITHY